MRWFLLMAVLGMFGCSFHMPGKSYVGALPALTAEQRELAGRLKGHVEALATRIGPRTVVGFPEKLEAAAKYIEGEFRGMGYATVALPHDCGGVAVRNIAVAVEGSDLKDEVVVVGAHYDSAGDCPAANDNGTGVASMLELARVLKATKPRRTVRFVAFVNEEPPYFGTDQMGSYVYAAACRKRGDKITAMLSLETMGFYSEEKGSQNYPAPLNWFYPDRGNFIGFGTRSQDRELLFRVVAKFREKAAFPSEGAALPAGTPGIWYSDHWGFWEHGFPALMVTDTAMFRYPWYHTKYDTAEKIDYEKLARVTEGLRWVIEDLAD